MRQYLIDLLKQLLPESVKDLIKRSGMWRRAGAGWIHLAYDPWNVGQDDGQDRVMIGGQFLYQAIDLIRKRYPNSRIVFLNRKRLSSFGGTIPENLQSKRPYRVYFFHARDILLAHHLASSRSNVHFCRLASVSIPKNIDFLVEPCGSSLSYKVSSKSQTAQCSVAELGKSLLISRKSVQNRHGAFCFFKESVSLFERKTDKDARSFSDSLEYYHLSGEPINPSLALEELKLYSYLYNFDAYVNSLDMNSNSSISIDRGNLYECLMHDACLNRHNKENFHESVKNILAQKFVNYIKLSEILLKFHLYDEMVLVNHEYSKYIEEKVGRHHLNSVYYREVLKVFSRNLKQYRSRSFPRLCLDELQILNETFNLDSLNSNFFILIAFLYDNAQFSLLRKLYLGCNNRLHRNRILSTLKSIPTRRVHDGLSLDDFLKSIKSSLKYNEFNENFESILREIERDKSKILFDCELDYYFEELYFVNRFRLGDGREDEVYRHLVSLSEFYDRIRRKSWFFPSKFSRLLKGTLVINTCTSFNTYLKIFDVNHAEKCLLLLKTYSTTKYLRHKLKYSLLIPKAQRDMPIEDQLESELSIVTRGFAKLQSQVLMQIGKFESAERSYRLWHKEVNSLEEAQIVRRNIIANNVWKAREEIATHAPQPDNPKGVVLFGSLRCQNTAAITSPLIQEIKERGYSIVQLVEGLGDFGQSNQSDFDQFNGILLRGLHDFNIKRSWFVDWQSKRVEADGINFYQGFYEFLMIRIRKATLNLDTYEEKLLFNQALHTADYCLRACFQIKEELIDKGRKVVIVIGTTHYVPNSIFRDFARHIDHENFSLVSVAPAYENFYSNLGNRYSTSMACCDLTLDRDRRAAFLGSKRCFTVWKDWLGREPSADRISKLISVNRSSVSAGNEKGPELFKSLKNAKSRGLDIVVCVGKIPVDQAVIYDGGPVHSSMKDWINHTIQCAEDLKDTSLFLIKPHPHEKRPEIAGELVESFSDLIDKPLPSNVIFLDHSSANLKDLAPWLDRAILWNGSSCLELTIWGVPVVMCSYFGKLDYPINLNYPESEEHYRNLLGGTMVDVPTESLKRDAMLLIEYMESSEVSLKNDFSVRQSTNDVIDGPLILKERIIDELGTNSNPHVNSAVDRILEKMTMNC